MRSLGLWIIIVVLCVIIVLMATDCLNIRCDQDTIEVEVPESLEEAGEEIEEAVDDLTDASRSRSEFINVGGNRDA